MNAVAAVTFGLAVFALGAAIFNLWIFWMRPREAAHLWLGVAAIGVAWLSAGLAGTYGALSLEEAQNALLLALGGALPLVTGFVRFSELFAGIRHPVLRSGIGLTCVGTVLVCADPSLMFDGSTQPPHAGFDPLHVRPSLSPAANVFYASFTVMIAWLVIAYARRARTLEGGRAIATGIAVWAACMLNDICVGAGAYAAPWLLPFGFVAFGGTFGGLLLRRLVRSQQQVERSAAELRMLVDARTGELRRKDLELAHGARLATLGALAGGIAHQIEQPLAAIDANVKELRSAWRDETRPEAFGELVAASLRDVDQVRGVVAELLQLARREEGRQGLHELPAVVAGVLPIASFELRKRARLETNLASAPPVLGDGAMLAQIALNLIVGAIHAFPESPPQSGGLIRVSTETDGDRACLVVSDNQPTAPTGAALDLFANESDGGAGERRLQLAVTKQLVERDRGEISIESGLSGTRVRVRFAPASALDEVPS